MKIKTILSALTLHAFEVSKIRKRQFFLAIFLLIALSFSLQTSRIETLPFGIGAEIIVLAITTLAINILASGIRFFVVSSHRTRRGYTSEDRDNFTIGMNAIVNVVTVAGCIIAFFLIFDIEVRTFLNSIALFAVALTLIFQEYIKSTLNGFGIMFSADYEIGDLVQVHDMPRGVIKNITFTSVHIKTESGDLLYIPNNTMKASQVVNFSRLKPKQLVLEFTALREQITDLTEFKTNLLAALKQQYPTQLETEKAHIDTTKLSPDEIHLTAEIPCKRASLKLKNGVAASINDFVFAYKETLSA